ncbi:hypothetical protein [Aeribacillus pallidus]|uniref:hypothetical protein n=1 Tax=Aeribacillus pallidus TaxID=33936 RepID=UPI0012FD4754|nr:hypothetical protein [Aeribacillus pallidus]
MKTFWLIISLLLVIFAFFYNLLGLMNLAPIFVSAPLLFISLFISFFLFNHRKTFRGF